MTALSAGDDGRLLTGMTAIVRANALALPLRDSSVDLIVTSPPYFALRSYTDDGTHYAGQIGAEPTPAAFVDALLTATVEMVRVLKPSGSLWINLGDKYAQKEERSRNGNGNRQKVENVRTSVLGPTITLGQKDNGVPRKSLIGVPWRYALRCIDELGLILRAEVIWSKPNGLPESVTDRVRRSHETWFHFTRSPKYYSAVDEIREPHNGNAHPRRKDGGVSPQQTALVGSGLHRGNTGLSNASHNPNPLGKLPGSVWTIATQPLKVPAELGIDHFAAFPMEWPRRLIRGWSPPGICTACGEGLKPVKEGGGLTSEGRDLLERRGGHASQAYLSKSGRNDADWGLSLNLSGPERQRHSAPYRVTGYSCACSVPSATVPAVVLDPFGGTGTTALMAKVLGRRGISVDMSADYCRLAAWRTTDPKQVDKATNPKAKRTKPMPTGDRDYDRIKRRHDDIPQDPLPIDVPDSPPAQQTESKRRPSPSIRFAQCPKCLADKETGVIRAADGTEVFRDHNKTLGKGRRIPCPGSGQIAPAEKTR